MPKPRIQMKTTNEKALQVAPRKVCVEGGAGAEVTVSGDLRGINSSGHPQRPLPLTPVRRGEAPRFQEARERSGPRRVIRATCLREGKLGGEKSVKPDGNVIF